MILSACLLEPWPIFIEAKGAPPTPIRYANAEMIIIIGAVTPNPANAVPPTSGMWPMYILSTKLYSKDTNCPIIAGKAMEKNNFFILPTPSLLLFIFWLSNFLSPNYITKKMTRTLAILS